VSILRHLRTRLMKFGKMDAKSRMEAKYFSELEFKKKIISQYVAWYRGEIPGLYGEPPPAEDAKVRVGSERDNAILTWAKVWQQAKYLADLELTENAFEGMRLLDVGSSSIPSGLCFKNCELFCLEPLLPEHLKLGFPFWAYEQRARFIYGFSEAMPFPDSFMDAVISVNALDHVDDFAQTVREIRRVSTHNARLRFHLHYHKATVTEPIELNDDIVAHAFSWCSNFHKHSESKNKRGCQLDSEINERFCVWTNF
jgi:SAM-dependent methyltransferase